MPSQAGSTWTIVVAAGSGSRFGGDVPKQFLPIGSDRVVDWSIRAAATVSDGIVVVVPPASTVRFESSILGAAVLTVEGGATRSASVRNGLAEVPDAAEVVLVHDAARPVASPDLFARIVDAVSKGADAVVPVIDVIDTINDVDGNTVDRAELRAVQTPQGFSASALRRAHADGSDATDDATLVRSTGGIVETVPGERWNVKITEAGDAPVVAALLAERS